MPDDTTPDEIDLTDGPSTMNRRQFVTRAAATGALVWAAPSVTSVASAFADAGGSEICPAIVDSFTTIQVVDSDVAPSESVVPDDGSFLGATRFLKIVESGPNSSVNRGAQALIEDGDLDISNDTGIGSTTTLTYDGLSGDERDLTQGGDADRFRFVVESIDTGSATFEVSLDDGPAVGVVAAAPGPYEILFSSFGGGAASDVGKITVTVTTTSNVDFVSATLRICYFN